MISVLVVALVLAARWPSALCISQIEVEVTTTEANELQRTPGSNPQPVLVNLSDKLRQNGYTPDGYQYSILYHPSPYPSAVSKIQLDKNTGEVRPPRAGFNREKICRKRMRLATPCEDSYVIQAEKPGPNKGEDTVSIKLKIIIRDVNDHKPQFSATTFTKSINENARIGETVSLMRASDKDGKDAIINYTLKHQSDSANFFTIKNERRGGELVPKLRLIKSLDREVKGIYHLTLVASDGKYEAELPLVVKVVDSNDNKPMWPPKTNRHITVSECERSLEALTTFDASDRDDGLFGLITYELSPVNEQEIRSKFHIQDNKLRLYKNLDFEDRTMDNPIVVEVDARDGGGLVSSSRYTVTVTDCNDNSPTVRVKSDKENFVMENKGQEKVVASVVVTDIDSGDNGKVDCHLENEEKLFIKSEDETSASRVRIYKIYTRQSARFDRESQTKYSTRVVCKDQGQTPRTGTAMIYLHIRDDNDNAPRFKQDLYKFRVFENSMEGTVVGTVEASDADEGENQKLRYFLDEEGQKNFQIKQQFYRTEKAKILSTKPFDREKRNNYTFYVTVRDRDGNSTGLSARTLVKVIVEDKNDNHPVFTNNGQYVFNVTEEYCRSRSSCRHRQTTRQKIGRVTATDPDLQDSAKIKYFLGPTPAHELTSDSNIRTYFRVVEYSGVIYSTRALDREEKAVWQFEVVAKDHGEPSLSSTATVTVNVLDLNDNAPRFIFPSPSNQTVYVDENAVIGTKVATIRAVDPDEGKNGKVNYLLKNPPYFKNQAYFTLDKTGTVTLAKGLKKHSGSYMHLLVQAKDEGAQPRSSALRTLKVKIRRKPPGQINNGYNPGGDHSGGYQENPTEDNSIGKDSSMQVLLGLAGVVFFVFAILLGILVYMYARGRLGLPCPPCLGGEPPRKEEVAAGISGTETAPWAPDSAGKSAGVASATPLTLRRNYTQETGYYEQEHFSDIIHFEDQSNREKPSNIDSQHAQEFNLMRAKSTSYGYIPVACEDRYMYSPHSTSLRKGSTDGPPSSEATGYQTFAGVESPRGRSTDKLPRKVYNKSHTPTSHKLRPMISQSSREHVAVSVRDDSTTDSSSGGIMKMVVSANDPSHAYTTLDASVCQQLQTAPTYDDAPDSSVPSHLTQLKTPYITSSFV